MKTPAHLCSLVKVLLTDGQMFFPRVHRFSLTFDERSARYKKNIFERAVKPKSKKMQSGLGIYCSLYSFSTPAQCVGGQ